MMTEVEMDGSTKNYVDVDDMKKNLNTVWNDKLI